MSTERRKPNRHATQPSWIGPPPSCREYAPAQAVISHLTRTATLTKGHICPERSGQKACEKDGVERHQAICGHEAALLRRTQSILMVLDTMKAIGSRQSCRNTVFSACGVGSAGSSWKRTSRKLLRRALLPSAPATFSKKCFDRVALNRLSTAAAPRCYPLSYALTPPHPPRTRHSSPTSRTSATSPLRVAPPRPL